ncbi:hypothetical protein [Rhizobium sp. SYY.PMSO]|uniref:hypothetical protein n=1 Tax=Rhizobium sp. SYY.PMSO TaxID=3382192 RepID=UPI00398F98CA
MYDHKDGAAADQQRMGEFVKMGEADGDAAVDALQPKAEASAKPKDRFTFVYALW